MKKIKKILIPYSDNLEIKWWHRLANVLIYGSAVLVIFFLSYSLFESGVWKEKKYTAYSFESNYFISEGKEKRCSFNDNSFFKALRINCGDLSNSEKFLIRFLEAKKTYQDISLGSSGNRYVLIKLDSNKKPLKLVSLEEIDEVIRIGIENGDFSDIKVKEKTIIFYDKLIKAIFIIFFIALMWFVFWESVIYRVLLYIIYGRKK